MACLPCTLPACLHQVFEQAGLKSPILGSIAMGLANLGKLLLAGRGCWQLPLTCACSTADAHNHV